MKKVIAAKIEQILMFASESEADAYYESMKASDSQFVLLDYDDTPTTEHPNAYTIRVAKSYNNSPMLVSSMTIYNNPLL